MSKKPMKPGTMIFQRGEKKPYWIIEWQPENGSGCYWIAVANGNWGVSLEESLYLLPQLNEPVQ